MPCFSPYRHLCLLSDGDKSQGFTVIEVLIALAIMSLIGIVSYSLLSSTVMATSRQQVSIDTISEFDRALNLIESDLRQMIRRPIRVGRRDNLEAEIELQAKAPRESALQAKEGTAIEFSRAGYENPLRELRADAVRVSYEVGNIEQVSDDAKFSQRQTVLTRRIWKVLDREEGADATTHVLLEGVTAISFSFLDKDQHWLSTWPKKNSKRTAERNRVDKNSREDSEQSLLQDPLFSLPVAIKFILHSDTFGEVTRVITLQ